MVKDFKFDIKPVGEITISDDLKVADNVQFRFNLSGETDTKTLKAVLAIIKRKPINAKSAANKT